MGRKVRGSYTVEAVFVIPLVTMIIILLIDMSLYLRDLTTARALAVRIAEETRALNLNDELPEYGRVLYERKVSRSIWSDWFGGTDDEDEEHMISRLREKTENAFWVSRAVSPVVEIGGGEVKVRFRLEGDFGIPLWGDAGKRWFTDDVACSVDCRDTVMRTRIYSAIIETGEKIKGVSEILEKLGGILNRLTK